MFCSKGLHAVKSIWAKITPELSAAADDILTITDALRKLTSNPTIEAIAAVVPEGSTVLSFINAGIAAVTTAQAIAAAPTTVQALQGVIEESKTLMPALANKKAFTIASAAIQAAAAAQGQTLTESEADSITQLKIITNKAENK